VLSSWLSGCYFRTWRIVREAGADSPRGAFGPGPRTVRLDYCRTAKSFAFWSVLPLWERLEFVPRVGTSVVTT
jgi:hypothetical protein